MNRNVLLFALLFILICAVAWYRKMNFQMPVGSVIIILDRTIPAEAYADIQRGAEAAGRDLHVRVLFSEGRKATFEHSDAMVVLFKGNTTKSDFFNKVDVEKMASPMGAGYAAVLMVRVPWDSRLENAPGNQTDIDVPPEGTSRPYSTFRDGYDRFMVATR